MKRKIVVIILICMVITGIALATFFIVRIINNHKNDLGIEKGGLVEYNAEVLNHFELKIIGFEGIQKNLNLKGNNFYTDMKQYIFQNGLVQATQAKYKDYEDNNKFIIVSFELNDDNKTTLYTKINKNNNTYTFFDDYK